MLLLVDKKGLFSDAIIGKSRLGVNDESYCLQIFQKHYFLYDRSLLTDPPASPELAMAGQVLVAAAGFRPA